MLFFLFLSYIASISACIKSEYCSEQIAEYRLFDGDCKGNIYSNSADNKQLSGLSAIGYNLTCVQDNYTLNSITEQIYVRSNYNNLLLNESVLSIEMWIDYVQLERDELMSFTNQFNENFLLIDFNSVLLFDGEETEKISIPFTMEKATLYQILIIITETKIIKYVNSVYIGEKSYKVNFRSNIVSCLQLLLYPRKRMKYFFFSIYNKYFSQEEILKLYESGYMPIKPIIYDSHFLLHYQQNITFSVNYTWREEELNSSYFNSLNEWLITITETPKDGILYIGNQIVSENMRFHIKSIFLFQPNLGVKSKPIKNKLNFVFNSLEFSVSSSITFNISFEHFPPVSSNFTRKLSTLIKEYISFPVVSTANINVSIIFISIPQTGCFYIDNVKITEPGLYNTVKVLYKNSERDDEINMETIEFMLTDGDSYTSIPYYLTLNITPPLLFNPLNETESIHYQRIKGYFSDIILSQFLFYLYSVDILYDSAKEPNYIGFLNKKHGILNENLPDSYFSISKNFQKLFKEMKMIEFWFTFIQKGRLMFGFFQGENKYLIFGCDSLSYYSKDGYKIFKNIHEYILNETYQILILIGEDSIILYINGEYQSKFEYGLESDIKGEPITFAIFEEESSFHYLSFYNQILDNRHIQYIYNLNYKILYPSLFQNIYKMSSDNLSITITPKFIWDDEERENYYRKYQYKDSYISVFRLPQNGLLYKDEKIVKYTDRMDAIGLEIVYNCTNNDEKDFKTDLLILSLFICSNPNNYNVQIQYVKIIESKNTTLSVLYPNEVKININELTPLKNSTANILENPVDGILTKSDSDNLMYYQPKVELEMCEKQLISYDQIKLFIYSEVENVKTTNFYIILSIECEKKCYFKPKEITENLRSNISIECDNDIVDQRSKYINIIYGYFNGYFLYNKIKYYMKDLPFRVNSTFLEFIPYPLYFNHPKGSEDKIMDYIEYEYYGNNDLIYKNNHFIQINNWNDTFDISNQLINIKEKYNLYSMNFTDVDRMIHRYNISFSASNAEVNLIWNFSNCHYELIDGKWDKWETVSFIVDGNCIEELLNYFYVYVPYKKTGTLSGKIRRSDGYQKNLKYEIYNGGIIEKNTNGSNLALYISLTVIGICIIIIMIVIFIRFKNKKEVNVESDEIVVDVLIEDKQKM